MSVVRAYSRTRHEIAVGEEDAERCGLGYDVTVRKRIGFVFIWCAVGCKMAFAFSLSGLMMTERTLEEWGFRTVHICAFALQ
jgi:hypothetical protein